MSCPTKVHCVGTPALGKTGSIASTSSKSFTRSKLPPALLICVNPETIWLNGDNKIYAIALKATNKPTVKSPLITSSADKPAIKAVKMPVTAIGRLVASAA